jgi:hypothetical protein
MIRANAANRAFQKRTIRPLYAWHSAVPYSAFLDVTAVGTTILYPGQVAVKTTGEQMDYARADGAVSFGLFNNFINGDMDDLGGGTEIGVWVGGRDAVFEVIAGPTAGAETPLAAVSWTSLNATRGGVALYPDSAGRLTNTAGSEKKVARLIEAVSASKIIIQLDLATA